jgi:riboflavin kinase/FMN adenylyltransferase
MPAYRLTWDQPAPAACRGGVLTIGNFDGVHRGHAALLAEVRDHARALQLSAVVMTFDPHPLLLLRPELYQPTLTTLDERSRLLHAMGADHVLIVHTEPALLQLSARDFFQRVIRDHVRAEVLVEGPNFAFGHNREGTTQTLAAYCEQAGIALKIVPLMQAEGVTVSSSKVRQALQSGDIDGANRLLGHPYRLSGVVGMGQRRGQLLGFPTANLTQVATLIPGDGVYAVRAWIDSQTWAGAANVGPNPTFGEQSHKVEVHLIGFQGDLYGRTLAIDFLSRLRDTRRFDSVDQLLTQIRVDIQLAAKRAADLDS